MSEISIAVLEERIAAMKEAVALQANEYRRRLDELNHAHAKAVEDRALTVSAEKFEGYVAEIAAWRATVQDTLSRLEGRSGGGLSARAILFQVVTVLISAIALVAALWEKT